MQSDLEQRIAGERASVAALDPVLDSKRTPYLKGQLRSAEHMLNDAVEAVRHANKAHPNYVAMWMGFAEMNFQTAAQLRQKVEAAIDMYGGPELVTEIGS
jgi:hypothetical protein